MNNFKELEHLVSRIATSMSNGLRTDVGSIPVFEQTLSRIPYVNVRWAYLALPISVILMTLRFLVAVMVTNRRAEAVMWKTHALAILAVGSLDGKLERCSDVEMLEEKLHDTKLKVDRRKGPA